MADDDIAIVGVGCRFPGADNLQEFWRVLLNGENHVVEIPPERWNGDAHFSDDMDALGKTYVKKAGLLKNYDEWDNKFFGVTDAEAAKVDPQQRYVLECTHMALEDGGITRSQISGSQTGVYIGVMNDDYKSLLNVDTASEGLNAYSATGFSTTIIASRVSYVFNLRGPCMVIDTACSSALIAIHLGCQAIRTGDCKQAICGGVSSILNPETFFALCKARMLSPSGQCQTFCDTADGYAKGEGCGVVILMKLKDARQQNAKIWGVIKTGSNQDGAATHPITAPSGDQQLALLKHVYTEHSIDPMSIQYIEAHGTGTSIGDPVEANTLGKFFSRVNHSRKPLIIGSVKSNIGHTESAAGVAGLIKVLLMMKYGKIVPSLHVKKDKSNINKKILLKEYNIDIAVEVTEWHTNENGERRACINSFGFGGSNCHAVLIQVPSTTPEETFQRSEITSFISISASDEKSLILNLESFKEDFEKEPIDLQYISFTSLNHRDKLRYKTLLYGTNAKDIRNQIEIRKRKSLNVASWQRTNLVFVYCGVGTTWKGMCRDMMKIDLFRVKIREIDKHLKPLADFKVEDLFLSGKQDYDDPFVNHICIFATQVALTNVWNGWNISPDVIVGQSVGEVAAAYASGIIPLSEAVRIIYYRSKILAQNTGGGMMVLGNMPVAEIEGLCEKYKSVTIAVFSSPSACTLSGELKELEMMREEVERKSEGGKSYLVRDLKVKCAYHSHFVDGCMEEIEKEIGVVDNLKSFRYPIISTVSSQLATSEDYTSGKYWAENVRKPVLFYQSLQAAMKEGTHTVFLEIGPRQVLRAHIEHVLQDKPGICLPSMSAQKELVSMYDTLVELYQMNYDIDWTSFRLKVCSPVSLPRFRFSKVKHLFIPDKTKRFLDGISAQGDQSHQYVKNVSSDSKLHFEVSIDVKSTPFVFDHLLSGTVLVPGAMYVDVGFHVASVYLNKQISDLTLSVEFQHPLTPSEAENTVIRVTVEAGDKNTVQFKCHNEQKTYAYGSVHQNTERNFWQVNMKSLRDRCDVERNKTETYDCLRKFDFNYGKTLSLIEKSWSNEKECIVLIDVPETVRQELTKTAVHPSVTDSVFQTFALLQQNRERGTVAMPKGVYSVQINAAFQERMYIYSHETYTTENEIHFNAVLLAEDGFVLARFTDMFAKIVDSTPTSLVTQYEISETRIDLHSTNTLKKGSVAVFTLGSESTSSCFETFVTEETCIRVPTFESIKNDITQAVVLYCHKPEVDEITLETAMDRFQAMKFLLIEFSKQSLPCPLFVITENTQQDHKDKTKAIQVSGSEYWGMVRTVRLESLHFDIRLVDLNTNNFSAKTLLQVISLTGPKHADLCVNGLNVCQMNVIVSGTHQHLKELETDLQESAVLCSSKHNCVSETWFKPIPRQDQVNDQSKTKVRLTHFVLHDESLFTKTIHEDFQQTICTENKQGYEIIAIESGGKDELNRDVIVCYPVKVQTPFVFVPKVCVIQRDTLPVYEPGMFVLMSIIYNLTTEILTGSSVLVVHKACENTKVLEILTTILTVRNCRVSTTTFTTPLHINNGFTVDSIMFLCETTTRKMDLTVKQLNNVKQIVSIDFWMPDTVQQSAKVLWSSLEVKTIRVAKILEPNSLLETIPLVLKAMKTAPYLQKGHVTHTLFLEYPMKSKTLLTDDNGSRVHLRVEKDGLFRKNGCYLVVGGLTGLGWTLLQVLAENGAGHLAVFSRRAPSEEKRQEIQIIETNNKCRIYTEQIDISNLKSLKACLGKLRNRLGNVPIRGIFQGAGVLSDAVLANQTTESVKKVFLPKIQGSWNLHLCSRELFLDFFVMHSSIVSVVGNVGQSNYAAGNSFMDSLAAYRHSQGLPGQSLNWGPLAVGMATDNKDLENHFRANGFQILSESEIKSCFIDAIMTGATQAILGKFMWNIVADKSKQKSKFKSLFTRHTDNVKSANKNISEKSIDLLNLSENDRYTIIKDVIKKTVCEEFLVSEDDLQDDTTFSSIGANSMAVLSFTNTVYTKTKIRVPIFDVLSDKTTIETVAQFCLKHLLNQRQRTDAVTLSSAKLLDDAIPFMQLHVLHKYKMDRNNVMLADIFEVEMKSVFQDIQMWKELIKQTMHQYPQLRTRYIFSADKIVPIVDKAIHDDVPELSEIAFPDVCDKNDCPSDESLLLFDLENQHPIKFCVAFNQGVTFLRIIIHKIVADLRCLTVICRTMNKVAANMKNGSPLPSSVTVDIPTELKSALLPKWDQAEQYWKRQGEKKIKPLTLGKHIRRPDITFYRTARKEINEDLYIRVEQYLKSYGHTIFRLFVSLFQLLLHLETSITCFSTVTDVDMSAYVPKLKEQVIRCFNTIPLLAEIDPNASVKDFFRQSSISLTDTIENGFYPAKLILDKIPVIEVKENLDRHYIIMNNMEDLNDIISEETGMTLRSLSFRKNDYETKFFIRYDMKRRHLQFELGYNTAICGEGKGELLLDRLIWMLENLEMVEDVEIKGLSQLFDNKLFCPRTEYTTASQKPKCTNGLHTNKEVYKNVTSVDERKSFPFNHRPLASTGFLLRGKFRKETTKGWAHDVDAVLERNEDCSKICMKWGKHFVDVLRLQNINLQQHRGTYSLELISSSRRLEFKTQNLKQANEWVDALRESLEAAKTSSCAQKTKM